MNWLKENVYVAAWLALPITVIIAFIQNKKLATKVESFPLRKTLAYLIFLICFPLSLSPFVELGARFFTGVLAVVLLIVLLSVSESDWHK
jgi:hypothetical protein